MPLEVQKRRVVTEQKLHPQPLLECGRGRDWRKIQVGHRLKEVLEDGHTWKFHSRFGHPMPVSQQHLYYMCELGKLKEEKVQGPLPAISKSSIEPAQTSSTLWACSNARTSTNLRFVKLAMYSWLPHLNRHPFLSSPSLGDVFIFQKAIVP